MMYGENRIMFATESHYVLKIAAGCYHVRRETREQSIICHVAANPHNHISALTDAALTCLRLSGAHDKATMPTVVSSPILGSISR